MAYKKDRFVGTKLYGYCEGAFGRYSYQEKTIIASGEDWVVVVDTDDIKEFASFKTVDEMWESIGRWRVEPEDEEVV